jgi:hypothetical protein
LPTDSVYTAFTDTSAVNSTSPQSKQIPAPQISPVKTKPEAVASSPASDEERAVKQRRLTSTSLLGQETPSKLCLNYL